MFDFLRRPGMRRLSGAMRRAIEADGVPPGDIAALGVVESPGAYAGHPVSYFRVFDPQLAANRAVDVLSSNTYKDLNAHLDLVVRTGFIERDGTVVIFPRSPAAEATVLPRRRAAGASMAPA